MNRDALLKRLNDFADKYESTRLFKQRVRERIHNLRHDEQGEKRPKLSITKVVIIEFYRTFKKPLAFAALGIIALLIFIPIATYLYFASDLTSKENIMNANQQGILLTDRNDKPFFTFYQAKNKKIIPFSDIPENVQHAVIATEDKDFYNHPGFSIRAIIRAVLSDVKEERLAYGASTITQQLAKNALLSQNKNFLRKYQEIVLAAEIERRFNKNEILEMYLNTVYFGEGAFGVEGAAKSYFGKSAKDLTLAESALLAGILPAPSALSPISGDRDRAFQKQKIVLQKMLEQKYITAEQKELAQTQTIRFNPIHETLNLTAPHFAEMVKDELIKKYGEQRIANSGYKIKTTLDLDWQEYAEQTVKDHVNTLIYNKASNGAAVVMDSKTGEIKALVGSKDWYDEKFGKLNIAVRPRQPGSSFKPIIYAKGFEMKVITPATVIDDKPITFPDNYKPKNYDGGYRGPVLVRRALANSLNIPAVEIMQKVGVSNGLEIAKRLGITTLNQNPSHYGLSLVLGSGEVPLVELTGAYAVFANQGKRAAPMTILEVKDKRGNVVDSFTSSLQEVLDPAVAYLISSILSDNNARQEVFGNALTLSRTAAVKTGTTENYRDALTVGYTPSLVIGVWVGNNDNTPMDNIAGSLGAAPIWRRLMEHFLAGKPIEKFKKPFGVDELMVCKDKGLKVEFATSSAYMEYFIGGTKPKEDCNVPTPITPSPTSEPTQTPTEGPKPTAAPQPSEIPTNTPAPTILNPTHVPTVIPTSILPTLP